ncbi:MAG TPA: hypothetical protein VF219_08790 [Vicinamibacterales bacterium]
MNERTVGADDRIPPLEQPLARLIRAGITTGIVDGLFSSVLSAFFYGSTVTRLFQGVAATLLGNDAFDGGTHTAAIGLAMHVGVAFGWSAAFLLLVMVSGWLRRAVATRSGAVKVAAIYGPAIWSVMSLLVIPLLLRRPPAITFRWWVQFVGHFPFVGLPIVWSIRRSPG